MKVLWHNHFGTTVKLATIISLLNVIVITGYFTAEYFNKSQQHHEYLKHLAKEQAESTAIEIASPMWSLENELIDHILKQRMINPAIATIAIYENRSNGKRIFMLASNRPEPHLTAADENDLLINTKYIIREEHDIIYRGNLIGSVAVFISVQSFYVTLQNFLAQSIIRSIIIGAMSVLTVILFTWRFHGNEKQAQRIKKRLISLLDAMPSALIAIDRNGHVLLWNSHAEMITGKSRKEMIGSKLRGSAEILNKYQDEIEKSLYKNISFTQEQVPWKLNGTQEIFDIIAYPLGDNGGVIRIDNVTIRARMEEMMAQTEKIMSVGGLAAGMAHEINNPLGAIIQGCQNIVRRINPDLPKNQEVAQSLGINLKLLHSYLHEREILKFLSTMQEAGNKAAAIVSDMLSFSRRSESKFAPCSLQEMTDKAIRLAMSDFDINAHFDFKNIEIVREFAEDNTVVRCNRTRIEQVILNIIKNAAQALQSKNKPDARHRITIRISNPSESLARMEIEDNGIGMDESVRRRVFEPFYTTKGVGGGTGLGLSVAYFMVVEQHRGELEVFSELGKGTKFTITLPKNPEATY